MSKLVITMQVVDDENIVLAEENAHIPDFDKSGSTQSISLVRQWVAEKVCTLKVDSITAAEDNTSDK